jgi:hypothetical protein
MKLDNQRQIKNFRDGCIKDLKETLYNNYGIEINNRYLEDFVNEIGELCYFILCCNQAIHYNKYELEVDTEEEFIKLYE